MSMPHRPPPKDILASGYDLRDLPVRLVGWLGVGLFAGLVVSGGVVAGLILLFLSVSAPSGVTPVERTEERAAGPRLETSPDGDRTAIERAARTHLSGYAWLDCKAGTARIPIERAMDLLAEQGWPDGGVGSQ